MSVFRTSWYSKLEILHEIVPVSRVVVEIFHEFIKYFHPTTSLFLVIMDVSWGFVRGLSGGCPGGFLGRILSWYPDLGRRLSPHTCSAKVFLQHAPSPTGNDASVYNNNEDGILQSKFFIIFVYTLVYHRIHRILEHRTASKFAICRSWPNITVAHLKNEKNEFIGMNYRERLTSPKVHWSED